MAKESALKSVFYYRKPEVSKRTGRSPSSIDRDEAAGLFPKRCKLGPRSVGWRSDELDAWIESRERAKSGDAA
ncbi:AlpA family phage regulatory protein [Myxococcota bacterium]|nr:AlpA family phage regulatory protein [Myxococcota bacterium]